MFADLRYSHGHACAKAQIRFEKGIAPRMTPSINKHTCAIIRVAREIVSGQVEAKPRRNRGCSHYETNA